MTNQVQAVQQHTPGPWEQKSIPGHLFELHNTAGDIVLRIRGGMIPTLADARLLEAAPELLEAAMAALDYYAQNENDDAPTAIELRAAIAKANI